MDTHTESSGHVISYPKCVVCGVATVHWCLACKKPLHRLEGNGRGSCLTLHERDCPDMAAWKAQRRAERA